jgi:chromate transporter
MNKPETILTAAPAMPDFAEIVKVWAKVGCLSFGGPAGQIALMHRIVVDEKRWIGERRFLQALNFCNLLPGPEAQQLATYLGWLMHGVAGGLAAGLLFILPGALVMLALSVLYVTLGDVPLVAALFFGLKCAVLVLVVEALIRIGRRALKGRAAYAMAVVAFVALFLFHLPFPLVVLSAGLVGAVLPRFFQGGGHGTGRDDGDALIDRLFAADPDYARRLSRGALRAGLVAVCLWLAPVLVLVLIVGGTYGDIAAFFTKMAVVTVGGAYAVLAYVAQDAVATYHWLSGADMLTGLGFAETTPGPLILVLQFVGFLAGHNAVTGPNGMTGALLATLLTLWAIFAPCFAFVFLGAPVIEKLQTSRALSASLAAITAAVVGVIANLALWFSLRVLFGEVAPTRIGPLGIDLPVLSSLHWQAAVLSLLAAFAIFRVRLGVLRTLALTSASGLILMLVS